MSEDSTTDIHHPEDKRPRMDVDVIDTDISASAEAVTRPVVGKDYPNRHGDVYVRFQVTIDCLCGEDTTVYSSQTRVTCRGCGRRWRVQR
jgi:hypothetical protein